MLRATLEGLAAHRLRLAATAVAVVLGVGFVSGTFVLTDTLRSAFDDLFAQTTASIDVAVRGTQEFAGHGVGERRRVAPELLDVVRAVDGVEAVAPDVSGFAQLIGDDGEPIGAAHTPGLGTIAPVDERLNDAEIRGEGRFPEVAGEVAVDAGTAAAAGIEVGDDVSLVAGGPIEQATVTALIGFGDADSLAGASLVMFDVDTALERFGREGYERIDVLAAGGVDEVALAERVEDAVGADYEVLTGEQLAEATSSEVGTFLGFFTTALLVFAGVSVFVGAFLIANTFTIIVAQRTRELALLRAVGASRRQILTSVLGEAAVVGLVGSLLGLGAGFVVALGLRGLLDVFGIDLPANDLVFAPRTAAVGVLTGLGVTVVAAVAPAVRSTRVPPVAALQAVAAPPAPRFGPGRYVAATLFLLGGTGMLAWGLFGGAGLQETATGAVLTMLGAALLAPMITRPVVRLLGAPVAAVAGLRGHLARENALRSPRRTAATASALMIGLAVVTFVMVLGASVTSSAEAALDGAFRSELVVNPAQLGGPPGMSGAFPPELVASLEDLDEVAVAEPLRAGPMQLADGPVVFVAGFDSEVVDQVLTLEILDGTLRMGDGELLVSDDVAEREGWVPGDAVAVTFAATGAEELRIAGIFEGSQLDTDWAVDDSTFDRVMTSDGTTAVYLKLADGIAVEDARAAAGAIVGRYPTTRLQDLEELKAEIRSQINQLLGLLSGLLLMSIVIALFGILNTLGLSVYERTREIGLLRAVGATRGQVRSTIRWEAVLIAVLGALLGVGLGVAFGYVVVRALEDEGISVFAIPAGQLLLGVVLAGLAGVGAAILPARRAARTDILRALEAA